MGALVCARGKAVPLFIMSVLLVLVGRALATSDAAVSTADAADGAEASPTPAPPVSPPASPSAAAPAGAASPDDSDTDIGTATAGDVGTGTDAGTDLGDGADGELFPCPKDTIVLMPYVPVIPKQYRVVVETSSHLHIDYSIYWDYDKHGGEHPMCQPATPELLDLHAAQVAMIRQGEHRTLQDVCTSVFFDVALLRHRRLDLQEVRHGHQVAVAGKRSETVD